MSAKIKIAADEIQLERGQDVAVPILIYFDKPTKVRGIRCRFHGAEETTATYTTTSVDSKGRSQTQTHTATEHVDIVQEEFLLQGDERMGFFSRIGDSMATWVGGGNHEVIPAGEHEFSVKLNVPADAPGSFKGKKCSVFYRLDVSVDLPIKIDWSQSHSFELPPPQIAHQDINPVHVVFPDASGRSFWDKTFGKDVKLNLALDRDVLSIGDQALAMLTVESPEPLKVNDIEISLVGKESSEAQGHTDGHHYKHPLGQVNSPSLISSESVHEFEILVPELTDPMSQSGTKFDVRWSVDVRLKIPWAKDPVISVPIKLVPGRAAAD
jgi:hypothetical protein